MRDGIATHHRLIHDLDRDLFAGALGYSLNNGTDLLGDPSLAADHFTHVPFGNMEFQYLAVLFFRSPRTVSVG